MAQYRRETIIEAPLADLWEFHSSIDGITAISPGWLGLNVISSRGPGGEPDPDVLEPGSEVTLSIRPLGIVPGGSMTSRITERVKTENRAWFCDEMVDGPFSQWSHRHEFQRIEGGTRMIDLVTYALPPGRVGRTISPIARIALTPMFRDRHRRTKALLE